MSRCTCNKDPEVTCIVHPRRCPQVRITELEDKLAAKVERIDELEQENQRLTGALSLIEQSTGGFANEVAKAALLEGGE